MSFFLSLPFLSPRHGLRRSDQVFMCVRQGPVAESRPQPRPVFVVVQVPRLNKQQTTPSVAQLYHGVEPSNMSCECELLAHGMSIDKSEAGFADETCQTQKPSVTLFQPYDIPERNRIGLCHW